MIVVYADGTGLGHLTRVQCARESLGLDGPVTVITSAPRADDTRVTAGSEVVRLPYSRDEPAARRRWLTRTIADLEPTVFIVDAFPAGLCGEIDAETVGDGVSTIHLARLLRWDAYRLVLPDRPLRYATTFLLEPLHADHQEYLASVSADLMPLDLGPPPVRQPAGERIALAELWQSVEAEPMGRRRPQRWLVAHSGPAAEVAELIAYARDQAHAEGIEIDLVVATSADAAPSPAPDVTVIETYPIWPLFSLADRTITAAGFNTMCEMAPHRDRHSFLAFPRRFDDQFERARRARRLSGSG